MKKSTPTFDVHHIAKLARLHVSEDEMREAKRYLNDILRYVDTLVAADTSNIEAAAIPEITITQLREDAVTDFPSRQKLTASSRFRNNLLVSHSTFDAHHKDDDE